MLYRDEADALRRAIQEALDRWPECPEKEALRRAQRDVLSMTASETRAQSERMGRDLYDRLAGRHEDHVARIERELGHRPVVGVTPWPGAHPEPFRQEYQQVPPPLEVTPEECRSRMVKAGTRRGTVECVCKLPKGHGGPHADRQGNVWNNTAAMDYPLDPPRRM